MEQSKPLDIAIVIPAFNESQRIQRTLIELCRYFEQKALSFEIIVVDDGSTDETSSRVLELSRDEIRLLGARGNQGKGAAIRLGTAHCRARLVFIVDADLPYSDEFFNIAIPLLQSEKCDAAIGARDLSDSEIDPSYPIHRVWMGRVFSHIVNALLPLEIADTQCGFKGFRADALNKAIPYTIGRGYTLDIELLLIMRRWGFKIERIPVRLIHHHGSKVRIIRDSILMLVSVLGIRFHLSRRYPEHRPTLMMEPVTCPTCLAEAPRPLLCRGVHRFCRCRKCSTLYQNPQFPEAALGEQYKAAYFRSKDIMTGYPRYFETLDLQAQTARYEWSRLERGLGEATIHRILDVGCGSGEFLKSAQELGKECWGNDLVEPPATAKIEFVQGNFLTAALPSCYFDLIVFNDSFEHFRHPGPVLQKCRQLLREGGAMVLNMPDPTNWIARLCGSSWISFKREHLVLYPRSVARSLLEEHSFRWITHFPSWQLVNWDFLEPRLRHASPRLTSILRPVAKLIDGASFWMLTSGITIVARLEKLQDRKLLGSTVGETNYAIGTSEAARRAAGSSDMECASRHDGK